MGFKFFHSYNAVLLVDCFEERSYNMTNTIYYAKIAVSKNKFASVILLVVSYLAFIVGYLYVFSNGGGMWITPPEWLLTADVVVSATALYILTRIVISGLKMKI
jgi:hypothetical protein